MVRVHPVAPRKCFSKTAKSNRCVTIHIFHEYMGMEIPEKVRFLRLAPQIYFLIRIIMALKADRTVRDTIRGYALNSFERGSPIFQVGFEHQYPTVSNKRGEIFLGFALGDVVDIDLTSKCLGLFESSIGSLIYICSDGILSVKVPKKWGKLPIGQPLYSTKDGKLSWKAIGPRVCVVVGKVDEDGFVKVRVGA